MIDMETLDLKQLKKLRGQIDKAITSYEDRKWSGRGRRPHWVGAHLSAGKNLDDIKE